MWNTILDILVKKVKQGVDVRVIFDDMGCIMVLPYRYDKKLEAMGIKCCVFNTFIPILSSKLNNRDHRKIVVIDGNCGFTGGINLADEYINAYEKHGHWKDTAIMIKGPAVWSLTVMFLTMWDYLRGTDEDYVKYRPSGNLKEELADNGYVQPFTDNPFDDEQISETVYLNLINKAKRYVYINTPYLIIDNEMMGALTSAAKSGVDVRIVTPHIPDKWYVHVVTRANYDVLVESGVKIYEYTPGFMHAKSFVADDEYGVIGTINLDYRSLYLHFECGIWLYKTNSIAQMKEDYMKTLQVSKEITLEECYDVSLYCKLLRGILRIFAPLM
jgi:cardiolipin synthase